MAGSDNASFVLDGRPEAELSIALFSRNFTGCPLRLKKEIQLEIAHVLFIDIVGYSKVLITEQSELLRRERALAEFEIALSDVVRETEQFRSAEVQGKLVRLPTGDGMGIGFS